jgi:hypothetical protein
MAFNPDSPIKEDNRVKKLAKAALSRVAQAQQKDPVGAALWPFLMGAEVALLFGVRVRIELWAVILVLAAVKVWTWSVENPSRSPLFTLIARLPKKKAKDK